VLSFKCTGTLWGSFRGFKILIFINCVAKMLHAFNLTDLSIAKATYRICERDVDHIYRSRERAGIMGRQVAMDDSRQKRSIIY
jgi:hypothetical protein